MEQLTCCQATYAHQPFNLRARDRKFYRSDVCSMHSKWIEMMWFDFYVINKIRSFSLSFRFAVRFSYSSCVWIVYQWKSPEELMEFLLWLLNIARLQVHCIAKSFHEYQSTFSYALIKRFHSLTNKMPFNGVSVFALEKNLFDYGECVVQLPFDEVQFAFWWSPSKFVRWKKIHTNVNSEEFNSREIQKLSFDIVLSNVHRLKFSLKNIYFELDNETRPRKRELGHTSRRINLFNSHINGDHQLFSAIMYSQEGSDRVMRIVVHPTPTKKSLF